MSKRRFNDKQLHAIEILSTPGRGGMTLGEVADTIGISERQLYTWRQDDVFMEAVTRRTIVKSSEYLPDIMASVPKHIIDEGNAAMLGTYMQAIGALTERVEVTSNSGADDDVERMRAEIERMRRGNDG